jgi:KRAB domain-containing zinc finger protein
MKVEIEIESENQKRTQNEKFQCRKCLKSFKKGVSLYVHKQVHEPKVKCQICSKEMNKYSLGLHLKYHENLKKFKCDHCDKEFVYK